MDVTEFVAMRLEELVDHERGSWPDEVRSLITGVRQEVAQVVEDWARAILAATPAPVRPSSQPNLSARRAILARTAAESAARCGRPQELIDQILGGWREGLESPARAIEILVERRRDDEAAVLGRYALARDPCPDGARIRAALNSLGAPPDGWHEAVLAFAQAPSIEAWDDLMRFTPDDALYHRTRSALQTLIRLGVDGDVLFRCATRNGTTPDAIELVERGLVDPETVVRRACDGPHAARGLWLGLAARAALARGDRFRTVRLLREAIDVAHPEFPPLAEVWAIREAADDALNELLDKVGIPR